MFWNFLRRFLKGWFSPNKRGYSLRGFWGEIKHFNKDGVQIGYSVKSFWGVRKRYDMNGNLVSYTVRNFWGGYNTYDANGVLIRKSHRNFWGGYNTYSRAGKKIMESYQSFWGGMNHFDMESSTSTETFLCEKRDYTKSQKKPATESAPSQTTVKKETYHTQSARNGERIYGRGERPRQSIEPSTSAQNKKIDYSSLFQQHIDKTIPFYESVSEFYAEQDNIENGVKILAFSYEGLKEFPAFAYIADDKIAVSPLIKDIPTFTFEKSEISEAKRRVVEALDMSVVDNEFASFCASKMMVEFDDLFPEYEFKSGGIVRTQYELKCGLMITEKSWLKLRQAFG